MNDKLDMLSSSVKLFEERESAAISRKREGNVNFVTDGRIYIYVYIFMYIYVYLIMFIYMLYKYYLLCIIC